MTDRVVEPEAQDAPTPGGRSRLTVVYNPVKVEDLDATKSLVAEGCSRHGWPEPTWISTTEEETGEKQAREAVEAGADVVASLGGDGTVRAVASALVGTDVALGLLPGGTGNLLARNLDLPVDALDRALEVLLTGRDRRIDVGVVRVADSLPEPESSRATKDGPPEVADDEEVFLVMTGIGLDGEVMAGTDEKVKARVGWFAYVLAAAGRLLGRGFRADVRAEGGEGIVGAEGRGVARHMRSVVIGNCGTLQGGIELMPDARVDDGILDTVVLAPHGAFGWVSVLADVVTRHRRGHAKLDRLRSEKVSIEATHAVEAEIDGDPIGEHRTLVARVLPESLVVRVA